MVISKNEIAIQNAIKLILSVNLNEPIFKEKKTQLWLLLRDIGFKYKSIAENFKTLNQFENSSKAAQQAIQIFNYLNTAELIRDAYQLLVMQNMNDLNLKKFQTAYEKSITLEPKLLNVANGNNHLICKHHLIKIVSLLQLLHLNKIPKFFNDFGSALKHCDDDILGIQHALSPNAMKKILNLRELLLSKIDYQTEMTAKTEKNMLFKNIPKAYQI